MSDPTVRISTDPKDNILRQGNDGGLYVPPAPPPEVTHAVFEALRADVHALAAREAPTKAAFDKLDQEFRELATEYRKTVAALATYTAGEGINFTPKP